MASALASLANASLVLALPTAGTVTDATTGNVTAATENVTISAFLRQGSPDKTELPGVEAYTEVFEGYAINPQALDARIKPGTRGTLAFAGQTAKTCEILAARHPYGTTGLIGSTLQAVIGDRIRVAIYGQR
jgi:hypothetical protein